MKKLGCFLMFFVMLMMVSVIFLRCFMISYLSNPIPYLFHALTYKKGFRRCLRMLIRIMAERPVNLHLGLDSLPLDPLPIKLLTHTELQSLTSAFRQQTYGQNWKPSDWYICSLERSNIGRSRWRRQADLWQWTRPVCCLCCPERATVAARSGLRIAALASAAKA